MIYALWLILFLHSACASQRILSLERPLLEGEAFAFKAIFGTSDMKKLLEIERDPAAYWQERQEALKRETISHIEFCQKYTEESLAYISKTKPRGGTVPWFWFDPTEIAETIASQIPKDHPAFPTVVALYTSMARDYLRDPHSQRFKIMETKDTFAKASVEMFVLEKSPLRSPEFNERLRWMARENSNLSIFDSLVLFSQKQYLCATPTANNREGFIAHESICGPPDFSGFSGHIRRDVIGHAMKQHNVEDTIEYQPTAFQGASYHEYFCQCWNKEGLIKNDIFALAEQSLGCFYNFHELASTMGAWSVHDIPSLIFPDFPSLTNPVFSQIVPYFTERRDHDWRTKPVEFQPMDDMQTHGTLLSFRSKYCGVHGEAILFWYKRHEKTSRNRKRPRCLLGGTSIGSKKRDHIPH